MRRRPAVDAPRITSRLSIMSSVHQIPLPGVMRQNSPRENRTALHTPSQLANCGANGPRLKTAISGT
jgi:hypothetical protein